MASTTVDTEQWGEVWDKRTTHYSGNTQVNAPKVYVKKGTVSSGQVVFHPTSDETSGGDALFTTYSLDKKITAQENAIKEIAGVLTAGGMVVADKDGKAMVNPLLLEAWKQAQNVSQPIEEWRQNNPTP